MSDVTNVIAKQKQMYYNAGTNASNVDSAVESLNDQIVTIRIGESTNGNVVDSANLHVVAPYACKVQSAYYVPNFAIADTDTDEILITLSCNGNAIGTYNSNASGDGALAAAEIHTVTLTAANVALAAGEKLSVAFTAEDATNNSPYGIVTALLRRQ